MKNLEEKIWKTNINTFIVGKKTIFEALKERDYLTKIVLRKNRLISKYKSETRYGGIKKYIDDEGNEKAKFINKIFAFDITTLIKERDEASKKCGELNLMIQRKN